MIKVLTFLKAKINKPDIVLMIWEVDDDLDQHVSKEEFLTMYKRCTSDETGLEPRKLFNLTQFLMYDKLFSGKVTVEDTLQILLVRHGRNRLDEEIKLIFGDNEKLEDGTEKEIMYQEYTEKINENALEEHKKVILAKQRGDLKSQKEEY